MNWNSRQRRLWTIALVFGWAAGCWATDASAKLQDAAPGTRAENFTLPSSQGKMHSLEDFAKVKVVVLAFLGTECPLAKHYAAKLEGLPQRFGQQNVQILGIFSNLQDSQQEVTEFARLHELTYPLLCDSRQQVVEQFRAQRTPEVIVLDSERVIRYRGRIDDQFAVGARRDQAGQEELNDAIAALLEGRAPAVAQTEPTGCLIARSSRTSRPAAVTYANQISRLFESRCNNCHRDGQAAPFALTSYRQAKGWAPMIAEVVREGRMPPWHADPAIGQFENDCHLSAEEQELIFAWVAAGAPEGNPRDLPAARQYASDWLLPGQPDLILSVTPEPVSVPAQGEVKYQYFKVDPKFTEDRWVKGVELRPGNYAVVHHILVFAREPGKRGLGGAEEGGFLGAYVPGLVPLPYPDGMAKRIPAGSELIFQMHYTPIGSAQTDHSQMALQFVDRDSVTHQVVTSSAVKRDFVIPPQADNHEVTGFSPRSERDVTLLTMMPHMHLRGKSFSYELHREGQTPEMLLSVPRYDFNWQTSYRLLEPLLLPAGSRIKCVAHYDNSAANPHNPDPTKPVRWGDQTWEEMMIGYFDIAVPLAEKSESPAAFGSRAAQLLTRLDKNGDGELAADEIPAKWLAIFFLIDKDKNGRVTLEELEASAEKWNR